MLAIANLEVVYHAVVRVLRGVSLAVQPGAVVALLGPNGAGKTTTLRAITGLLDLHEGRITKGSVVWQGRSLADLAPEAVVRQGVAQVMEGRRILVDLTVEENLVAGAWAASRRVREELERAYARFPVLGERRHRTAGYLSGGEQQMLAVARALMSGPRLLLLDEPSLGLSPRATAEVAALIGRVHDEGVSVLLVEQNAAMALDLASHGYVLENGRIVVDGPSAELKADRDVREFYLGVGGGERKSFRQVKLYRRRRRWLS